MLARLRAHTRDNVVGYLALFVALGGTSFAAAAVDFQPNSVGTAQLKKNAVISSRVKDGSLLGQDFKRGSLPAGRTGRSGASGKRGRRGPPGPFITQVPSGRTLRGVFGAGGRVTKGGEAVSDSISFGIAVRPAPAVHFVPPGGRNRACPQSRTFVSARPGNLCIFGYRAQNVAHVDVRVPNDPRHPFAGDAGAFVLVQAAHAGPVVESGEWVVTAR